MRLFVLLIAAGLLLSASSARAEFYRWIDTSGREHYTDDPAKIPAAYRDQADAVGISERNVSEEKTPAAGDSSSVAVTAHKDKYGRGEEWWRRKAGRLRTELLDLRNDYRTLQEQEEEWKEQQERVISTKKKARSPYRNKLVTLENKIARVRRKLEVDLPEAARKADAYPGWIRE